MRIRLFLLAMLATGLSVAAPVRFTLSFPEPQTHYIAVDLSISDWKGGDLDVYMPVWTPGSYLVREFSRNVEQVTAIAGAHSCSIVKTSKNHWLIKAAPKGEIKISYLVYAFEFSVRTSFVDSEHANINGSSVFMAVKGYELQPHIVLLKPSPAWKVLSVPLESTGMNTWEVKAAGYDELIDAPFEIGNHKVLSFDASGVHHEIAMVGDAKVDEQRFIKDVTRIVNEAVRVFGTHPCKRYIFFVQNLGMGSGGGGLEHKNACTVQTSRWSYQTESGYDGFLGLMAHEYFHLWNVKRLRPQGLGPFNYDEEVYTDLLYVAEGFTAYYEDLLSVRCGFLSEQQYLSELAGRMNYIDNTPGNKIQSAAESGYDAWIKYYRSNENSNNATISYYTKGSVLGALLNFSLLEATGGKAGLDSLMRYMYTKYALQMNKGYTSRDFMDACALVGGRSFDDFFTKYVYGTDSIPYQQFLNSIGLQLQNLNEKQNAPWLGITTTGDRKAFVKTVERNSPAWRDGINVNDELIAVNEIRLDDDISRFVAMYAPGDTLNIRVSRNNEMMLIPTVLGRDQHPRYALEISKSATEQQKLLIKNWLH